MCRDQEEEDDETRSNPAPPRGDTTPVTGEYPVGSRLRIKYGKGKSSKVYDAKVSNSSYYCGHLWQSRVGD